MHRTPREPSKIKTYTALVIPWDPTIVCLTRCQSIKYLLGEWLGILLDLIGCRRPQTAMKEVKTYLKHNPFFLIIWFFSMIIGISLHIALQCGKY